MNYGMPYKGSKNKIAPWILEHLPEADNLFDLFGGGGAITHCAALSGKYKTIHYNDIQSGLTNVFKKAVNGEYKNYTDWVSRENFEKSDDIFVKMIWSFGNNCKGYLYSPQIEPWKKAIHYAIFFQDYSLFKEFGIDISSEETYTKERRLDIARKIKANHEEYKQKYIKWYLKENFNYDYKEKIDNVKEKIKEAIQKEEERLRQYLIKARDDAGLKRSDVLKYLGNDMAKHYFGKSQWIFPTLENYNKMREIMPSLEDYWKVYGEQSLNKDLQSLNKDLQSLESLQSLQSLASLQSLQSLERLQRLELLTNIKYYEQSYDEFEIPENSVIYCDIPYKGTSEYLTEFDYEKFYNWAAAQKVPIFISEYDMPEDRFKVVAEKEKGVCLAGGTSKKAIEKIFIPKKGEDD